MSGDSTHGVGLVPCALAAVASAVSAIAAKTVFVENPVIVHSPATDLDDVADGASQLLNKPRTPLRRQYNASWFATLSFHDSSFAAIFQFQFQAVLRETRRWGCQDERHIEGLLFYRIVGFDSGAGRRRS
jgi:hypothetical protein